MKQAYQHQPVLLEKVIECLNIKPDGIYIDGTFGRGGHSKAILSHLGEQGMLLAIDKDPQAVVVAEREMHDKRFHIKHGSFSLIKQFAERLNIVGRVNGILLDLGVSSPQLDDPERGFSFLREGPLDMRMDHSKGVSAKEWLAKAKAQEIEVVLRTFGEERFAKRIAKAIINDRQQQPIETTKQLADIIAKANPRWEAHKHPATRSFQAIRVFINRELDELNECLERSLDVLAIGGRLLVICFQSLEDRVVKKFMRKHEKGDSFPKEIPVTVTQLKQRLKKVSKAVRAGAKEIKANPRARSANLRMMEKVS